MVIGEIFQDDINRPINGVVKVDEKNDDVLVQELEEYVITNDLKKHFMIFFNSYQKSFEGRTTDIGVWISGFFGSGKSHFLKMLSYLLANKEVKGVRTVERFRQKFKGDSATFMPIDSVTRGHTDTILFNIETEGSINKDKTAVLRVFAKMFYNYLGFYGENLKVVKLEQHLKKRGKTEEFRRVFEEKSGIAWMDSRGEFDFYEDDIVATLHEVLGMSETSAQHWFDGTETPEMSISQLVSEIKEYVDSKPEGFRLFFMADEVGQYIGEDLNLLLNLQSLVEKIGSDCGGKVWVVCTGQEAIDEVIKARENEFSRIQARFKTRLSLTSSSVDEVIQKRILKKKTEAERVLEAVYNKNDSVLRNIFTFTANTIKDIKGYKGEQDFVKNYPFVPYQFIILQKVFSEIRKHGNAGTHLSRGERSMLSGFQEAAQKIQNKNEYALVPFYLFYNTVLSFLDTSIRGVIERCEQAANNGDGIEPQDVDVLKLLYLIRYVDDIPANLDNIVILMADRIDMDKVEMRERVRGSLDRLLSQNYIGRSGGDTYNFLTDEEQEIQRNIYKNTHVDTSAIIEEIGKKIFSGIYDKEKYRMGNYDFPFDKYVDDKVIRGGTGGVKLTILTTATDIYDKDESRLVGASYGQAIIVLADTPYYQPIENAEKIWKYTRMVQGKDLSASTKKIIQHHQEDANNYEKIAKEELEKAIAGAKFYVHGEKIDIKAGNAKEKIEEAMKYLITHVYNKLGQIATFAKDDNDIRAILQGKYVNGLDGMERNREAVSEVEDFLDMQEIKKLPTSMFDLQKRFQDAPYGWKEIDIAAVVAQLIIAQKVTVKYGGDIIGPDHKELVNMLRKRSQISSTIIAKRQLMSERKIKQVKDILWDYFDVMNVPNDEDSLVKVIVENFEAQKEHYEKLKERYEKRKYPGQQIVYLALWLAKDILSQKKDHIALFERLIQRKDLLLRTKVNLENIENFFKSQVKIFDEAVKMVEDMKIDISYMRHEEKLNKAFNEICLITRLSNIEDENKNGSNEDENNFGLNEGLLEDYREDVPKLETKRKYQDRHDPYNWVPEIYRDDYDPYQVVIDRYWDNFDPYRTRSEDYYDEFESSEYIPDENKDNLDSYESTSDKNVEAFKFHAVNEVLADIMSSHSDSEKDIYKRIPELNGLMDTVKLGHNKLLYEKRNKVLEIVNQCLNGIKETAGENEKCMTILAKAHDFFSRFEDQITAQKSLAILDGMVQQLWTYKDETIEKLESAKRPTKVVAPEEPIAPSAPVKSAPTKKSKPVYRQQFPKKVLGSEADIDAYVEEVRAYLKKMMENGDEIDLK